MYCFREVSQNNFWMSYFNLECLKKILWLKRFYECSHYKPVPFFLFVSSSPSVGEPSLRENFVTCLSGQRHFNRKIGVESLRIDEEMPKAGGTVFRRSFRCGGFNPLFGPWSQQNPGEFTGTLSITLVQRHVIPAPTLETRAGSAPSSFPRRSSPPRPKDLTKFNQHCKSSISYVLFFWFFSNTLFLLPPVQSNYKCNYILIRKVPRFPSLQINGFFFIVLHFFPSIFTLFASGRKLDYTSRPGLLLPGCWGLKTGLFDILPVWIFFA